MTTFARHSNFCARPPKMASAASACSSAEPWAPAGERRPGAAELEEADLHRVERAALEPVECAIEPADRQMRSRPDVVVDDVDGDRSPAARNRLVERRRQQLERPLQLAEPDQRDGEERPRPRPLERGARRLRNRDRTLGRVARLHVLEGERLHARDAEQRHREVGGGPERLERLAGELVLAVRALGGVDLPVRPAEHDPERRHLGGSGERERGDAVREQLDGGFRVAVRASAGGRAGTWRGRAPARRGTEARARAARPPRRARAPARRRRPPRGTRARRARARPRRADGARPRPAARRPPRAPPRRARAGAAGAGAPCRCRPPPA